MRYAVSIILLFISLAAFGQLSQFRMVGSGTWSVVDDSTYSATVTFAADLTANSFLPTGIVDSMRVFTQRGQVYTIDSVGAKTFSTAVIYAVEYGGNWGSPSGQVLVYETRGLETVPAIPFATNGATSKLQEAVVTHNAAINNGISTATLADSTAAAKTYTNNQVAAVAPVKDTIVQASHGFSLGDPIWYSGDYLLALDTGTTVRVDGIVSEVPDANTFVLQRTGKFTLSSHGFTVGVQLYVQSDGSYSGTPGDNSLAYGYALTSNEIEIGLKPDQTISRLALDNKLIWNSSSKYTRNTIINYLGDQYRLTADTSRGETPGSSNTWVKVTTESNAYVSSLLDSVPFLLKKGQTVKQIDSEVRYKILRELPSGAVIDSLVYFGPLDVVNLNSENLFRQTENIDPVTNNGWISTGGGRIRAIGIDSIADPFGNITAEVLDPDGTSSYKAMRQELAVGDTIWNNEQYYLSFWFKAVDNMNPTGYSIDFSISDISGTDYTEVTTIPLNTSDSEWRYYQVAIPQWDSTFFTEPNEYKLRFQGFLFNGTETFSMSRMSFTRDPSYEYVPALNDSILPRYRAYAQFYVPTKIINWSELPSTLTTDQEKWDFLEIMGQAKILKGVFIDDVVTISTPFNRPEGFSIYGNYTGGQFRPENYPLEDYIIVDINNDTLDAIIGTELAGETVYVAGEIKNMLFHAISPVRAVINENEGLYCNIDNVLIDCDYNAASGIILSNEEFGSNNNTLNAVRIFRAKEWALRLDTTGAITEITGLSQFHRSKGAIRAYGSFICDACHIEKIDSIAVYVNNPGGAVRFYNTYIEGGNFDLDFDNDENGGDSTIMKIDKARLFRFDGGLMAGADSTKHFYELDSVEVVDISFSRNIFQGVPNDNQFILEKQPSYTDIRTMQNFGDSFYGNQVQDFNVIKGLLDSIDIEDSEIQRSEIYNSQVLDGSGINGQIEIDQIYLSGVRENSIANSSFPSTLTDDFTRLDTIANFYGKEQSSIVFRLDSVITGGSTAFITITNSAPLVVDSVYTFSFYARKVVQVDSSQSMTLISRHADDSGTQISHTLTSSFVRYVNTFTAASTNTALRIRLDNDNRVGNTFAVSGFQLVKGSDEKSFIDTEYEGGTVNDTISKIRLLNELVLDGVVQITESLKDSDGDTGTAGQLFASTATGTNWSSPSYGEAYIDYVDPDSVTVATAGNLYDLTDVIEGSSSADVTVSSTTGRLTYTGSTEKLFEVTWTASVTSNASNENLIGTVIDNGATITRIRWEEEDAATGDSHSVAASGFFNMGQNDWVQPKLTAETNGTEIKIITMSFRIKEVR